MKYQTENRLRSSSRSVMYIYSATTKKPSSLRWHKYMMLRKAGGSLLIAHWLLLVACKWKVGAQLTHFVVFPVSSAKGSQSMIITVIIGHLPNHCSSTTTWHCVFTAHPNSTYNTIFVQLHTSLFFAAHHKFFTYT